MQKRGWIFFDGTCGICSESVRRYGQRLRQAGFELIPLQDPRSGSIPDLVPGQPPAEMKLLTPRGKIFGGVDALAYMSRYVWWAFPFHLAMMEPFFRSLMIELYKLLSRYRHRISRTCGLKPFTPHN